MNDRRNEIKKIPQDSAPELYSETIEDDIEMEFEGVNIACFICDRWIGYFERIKINLNVFGFSIEWVKCPFCDQSEMFIDILL